MWDSLMHGRQIFTFEYSLPSNSLGVIKDGREIEVQEIPMYKISRNGISKAACFTE